MAPKVRNAEFEYVCGPMRVGDEHPSHPNWFYTGRRNRRGVLLWYRPPGPISRWVRRIIFAVYFALVGLGIFAGLVIEKASG